MPGCISNEAPDKHIEEVWYGLKTAIQNTYSGTNIPIPIYLEDVSSHLNILQSNQNYQEIEKQIVITIGQICRFYV